MTRSRPKIEANRKRAACRFLVRSSSLAVGLGIALWPGWVAAQDGFIGTGVVTSGSATFGNTSVTVQTAETIIDWTTGQSGPAASFDFLPEGNSFQFFGGPNAPVFTVLNRINSNFGTPVIQLNGNISSAAFTGPGGNIWFYAPGGILTGDKASFNVGSLLLTSNAIDVTGGLFGSNGEIRLRGAANSTSAIRITNGTSIQTTMANSYVAIVAPRIEQGGNIFADGSTALVAAEQVDLTFNAGLFDVNVLVGTNDPNGIVHTGDTGGPGSLDLGDVQRVTMVAVPKNNALTMLLSGNIGYQPASSADQDGSAVNLSAGYSLAGDTVGAQGGTAEAGITITDAFFGSAVGQRYGQPSIASGPITIARDTLGKTEFAGYVRLHSDTAISLTAETGETIQFDNAAVLEAGKGLTGGTISLLATGDPDPDFGSGVITAAANLDLYTDTSFDVPIATGTGAVGRGGTISLIADQGIIAADQSITASARGEGQDSDAIGGLGQGGSVTLRATRDGAFYVPNVNLSANGYGGDAPDGTGGAGRGGSVSVTENGGALNFDSLDIDVSAGGAYGLFAGDGFGGTVRIDISGAFQSWNSLYVEAGVYGGYPSDRNAGYGGSAIGNADAIHLDISGNGALETDYIQLRADAVLQSATGPTGVATAGQIAVTVDNGGSLVNLVAFDATASAYFSGEGFQLGDYSAAMQGGGISLAARNDAQVRIGSLYFRAYADATPALVTGGVATGGTVSLSAESGARIVLDGESGASEWTLDATAFAANGTVSSDAFGGTVHIFASDGEINMPGDVVADARAMIGYTYDDAGTPGGSATGGSALVEILPGTAGTGTLDFGSVQILADGLANSYGGNSDGYPQVQGNGGDGFGGSAVLRQYAGSLLIPQITLSAEGGGMASYSNPGSDTRFTSGSGTGGTARFEMRGGTAAPELLHIFASGFGGAADNNAQVGDAASNGGLGRGGTAELRLLGGTLDLSDLDTETFIIEARGIGGDGMNAEDAAFIANGGKGGNAVGGTAAFTAGGVTTPVALPFLYLDATATGGQGGTTFNADTSIISGNGGDATGGTSAFSVAGSGFDIGEVDLAASATAGNGVDPGDATGGLGRFIVDDSGVPGGTVLPDGFVRSTGDLVIRADATPGMGSTVQGLSTNGHVDISVAAGQPGAAVTVGGELYVTASGVLPAATPGIAVSVSGQPFTIAGDATLIGTSGVSFANATGAPFYVEGNLLVASPATVTGTGPIIVDGQSNVTGVTGIDLEYLSSGDTADFSAPSGAIVVSKDLRAVDLVTASGQSISFKSLAGQSFGPLAATAGGIAIDLAGDGLFTAAVNATAAFALTTSGSAVFDAPVTVGSANLQVGTTVSFADSLTAATSLALKSGGNATFATGVIAGSGNFDIGGVGSFQALTATGPLTVRTVGAGNFAAPVSGGASSFDIGQAATFNSTLTATGALNVKSGANALFAGVVAGSGITLDATGSLTTQQAVNSTGILALRTGTTGTFGALTATGAATANLGGNGLFNGAVTAASLNMTGGGTAQFAAPIDVQALLSIDIPGLLSFAGLVNGADINLRSGDIAIGADATIGTFARTLSLDLQSAQTDAPMIVGGADQTGGYSLSNAEFGRLRATDLIEFFKPGGATAPALEIRSLDARAQGGQLGTQGVLGFQTPGNISVTGNLDFVTTNDQAGVYLQGFDVKVHTDTGGIALHDSTGALQGLLRLRGQSVGVMSDAAFQALSTQTDLAQKSTTLGQPNGKASDAGALTAGQIEINFENGAFIQNSGTGTAYADRRGFTARSMTLFSGEGAREIAINGRIVNPQGGFFTGLDTAAHITINDSPATIASNGFAALSTINGCVIGTNCAAPPPPPPPPPPPETPTPPEGTLPPSDTIANLIDGGSGFNVFQLTSIELGDVTVLDTTPLVDEPVTSVGNEDLWRSACGPDGGEGCSTPGE